MNYYWLSCSISLSFLLPLPLCLPLPIPLPPSLLLPLPLPLPPPTLPPSLPPSLSYPLPLLSSLPPSLSPDLSSVACSCLLSLVVALGDTGKMLAALSALLTSPPPLSDHSLLVCTPQTSSAVYKYTYIHVIHTLRAIVWETWGVGPWPLST